MSAITAPQGFVAAGVHCGIKADGVPDLALVATADRRAVAAAAVFTSNLAAAAPVQVSRAHLQATGGRAAAVVLNSGNANAATGGPGRADAERTCDLVAARLGCRSEEVIVCSTGLIGIPLPMAPIEAGMPAVCDALAQSGGDAAAVAIMTTDTRPRQAVFDGDHWCVGGMAKGAAMLAPDMATMLAVVTTDADIAPDRLAPLLRSAVQSSFNALTVDGCTSTNDTVVVLASGAAGEVPERDLADGLTDVCSSLARQMAADAEGATKYVTVVVRGAVDDEQARRAARKVAESQLVKCSLYGADPYWGRIVSELGSAGVDFDVDRVLVAYGEAIVCRDGMAAPHDAEAVAAYLAQRHVLLTAHLGLGDGIGSVLTTDLSHAYIDENMRTS